MLSAAGGCELSTTTQVKTACKKFKKLIPVLSSRHLSLKTCGHVYSPWPLTKPSLQRLQRNDRAWSDSSIMLNHKTLPTSGPLSYLHGLALKTWTSSWKREGSAGMDMCNAPTVQSRQPLTYTLLESVGLGGPRWLGSSWQRGIAESGSSQISTLTIETPGDLVWDLPCIQQASYCNWAHCCGYCPCTCTLIKKLMMMLMMIIIPQKM